MLDAQLSIYRLCAMYDEPGVVGTMSALFLVAGGGMVGDNREVSLLINHWNTWLSSSTFELLFGYSQSIPVTGAASGKMILINKGLIGFLGVLLIIIFTCIRNRLNWPVICLGIVFIVAIYQRPFVLTLPFMLILVGGSAYLRSPVSMINHEKSKKV